jgi:hypothetical protein
MRGHFHELSRKPQTPFDSVAAEGYEHAFFVSRGISEASEAAHGVNMRGRSSVG